jgi:hypothetical protein
MVKTRSACKLWGVKWIQLVQRPTSGAQPPKDMVFMNDFIMSGLGAGGGVASSYDARTTKVERTDCLEEVARTALEAVVRTAAPRAATREVTRGLKVRADMFLLVVVVVGVVWMRGEK